MRGVEDRFFVTFVVIVSIAMLWISLPFYGAVLWALVTSILFWPMYHGLLARMPHRRNSAALLTLLAVIGIVILPAVAIGSLLVDQAITIYQSLQSQEINVGRILRDVQAGLPAPVEDALDRMGFGNMAAIEARLSSFFATALRAAVGQALSIGQGAFGFVVQLGAMLYLTYFFVRDGRDLTRKIGQRMPMKPELRANLFEKFTTVIKATIKGSLIVAVVQGLIGGIVFWSLGIQAALLWGVVMGFFSLLPAIGTGIIWVPVAIYLFATGSIWQGVVLVACGILIIGMVDNVLRPILVGKDTRIPDWVVLITTLGGIAVMGINGFIVGPVIAALFIASWDIFAHSNEEEIVNGSALKSQT